MPTKQYAAKVTIGGTLQSSFKSTFGGASDAIGKLGKEVRTLSSQAATIRKFGDQRTKIDGFKSSLVTAKDELKKLRTELATVEKPTAKMTRAVEKAERKVKSLEGSIEKETAALGGMILKLNQAGIKSADFARHQEKAEKRIAAVTRAIKRQNDASEAFSKAKGRMGSMMAAGFAVAATALAFVPAVKASNEFADSMVDVGKYVNGLDTDERLAAFGETIREIGRNSPIAAKGVSELVIGAGKLGMPAQEAIEFAKAMEVMAAGLDMMPDEAATILTKIKSSMRQTLPDAIKLGDAMNYLGDVTASDSKNIADIMSRVGSTVKSDSNSSLTDAEIAAVAAQFDIAAPNAESAATAMKNFTKALSKGEATSKGNEWAYSQLGLDPIAISKKMTTDAKSAMALVLDRLGKLKPDKRAGVMTKLFGEESKGVIQNVIAAQDDLKKSLAAVGNESNFVGRSEQERQRNLEKFGTQLSLFKSKVNDVNISIGDVVKEAIGPLLKKTNDLLDKFFIWRKEKPKLFKGIVIGAAACVVLAGAFVGIGMAIAAVSVAIAAFGSFFAGLGVIFTAGAAPILIAVAAIGAAALIIRKYWEPISAFFQGVWKGISDGWKSAGGEELWARITEAFDKGKTAVLDFLEPVKLSPAEFDKFFQAGEKVGKFIGETLVGFINGSIEFIKMFIATVKDMGSGIADFFGGLMEKMKPFFNFIGEQVSALMGQIQKLKGWMDSTSGNTKKDGVANPAMLPSGGGNFMPAPKLNIPPPRGAVGKPTSQINHFQINAAPGMNERELAREVARVFRDEQDQMSRGSLFDSASLAYG